MITRYSRPDAVAIWSQETKYKIWFEIEAHAATKMAELGVIPREAADAIWAKGGDATFDADRIDEIERTTKHDVIAFLTHVAEIVGDDERAAADQDPAAAQGDRAAVAARDRQRGATGIFTTLPSGSSMSRSPQSTR